MSIPLEITLERLEVLAYAQSNANRALPENPQYEEIDQMVLHLATDPEHSLLEASQEWRNRLAAVVNLTA